MMAARSAPWQSVSFLFENGLAAPDDRASFFFESPLRRITARTADDVPAALAELEHERRLNRFACGYLTYEAGRVFTGVRPIERRPTRHAELPLLDFFSFERHEAMTAREVATHLRLRAGETQPCAVYDLEATETLESYCAKVRAIQEHIGAGETYQVNLTMALRFGFQSSPLALYCALRERQRVAYGAFVEFPDFNVLSFSPELFVRKEGEVISAMPMKGTARRGASPDEDRRLAERLTTDPKTLSENVMIVDLIRNDLGRIAQPGSLHVDSLFEVQTFESVHQLVSRVSARIAADTPFERVMASLHPCGSVTGAPKIRTMEIIQTLEPAPRGIYTGALGILKPTNDFCFSVPIRTIVTRGSRGELGVGSGVVADSVARDEFDECILKASFLTGLNSRFGLIETMRLDAPASEPARLEAHLARLRSSAVFFGFAFDRSRIAAEVRNVAERQPPGPFKMRVGLSFDGSVAVSVEPIESTHAAAKPWAGVSHQRIDSASCFQHHKTTMRDVYETEFRTWRARGAYDVVFLNERDEVVEASRHNLFIERHGQRRTPPLASGALGGIERRARLDDSAWGAREERLTLTDVRQAERVFLTNAVRGVVEVELREE